MAVPHMRCYGWQDDRYVTPMHLPRQQYWYPFGFPEAYVLYIAVRHSATYHYCHQPIKKLSVLRHSGFMRRPRSVRTPGPFFLNLKFEGFYFSSSSGLHPLNITIAIHRQLVTISGFNALSIYCSSLVAAVLLCITRDDNLKHYHQPINIITRNHQSISHRPHLPPKPNHVH